MSEEQAQPTVSREVLLSLQLQEKEQEIEYLRKVSYERLVTIQILAEGKRVLDEMFKEMKAEFEALKASLPQVELEMPQHIDWEEPEAAPVAGEDGPEILSPRI